LWFAVCGLWFVVCGLWFVVCDLWFEVSRSLRFEVWSFRFRVYGLGVVILPLQNLKPEPGTRVRGAQREREFFIDNLLVRIHFIIAMIRWIGLAFEFRFPGSLTSTFLVGARTLADPPSVSSASSLSRSLKLSPS